MASFYSYGDYVAVVTVFDREQTTSGDREYRLSRAMVTDVDASGRITYTAWSTNRSTGYIEWGADVDAEGYSADYSVFPLNNVDESLLSQFTPLQPGDWPQESEYVVVPRQESTVADVASLEAEVERLRNIGAHR